MAGLDLEVEPFADASSVRIGELNVLELHTGAAGHQRPRLRMVDQAVRHEQRRQGFREAREVLRGVNESNREIARRRKDGQPQRRDQDDLPA